MKGIILLALSNISRKKGQSILIGLAIFITTLLFATAAGLLVSMESPVEQMFENLNGSHIIFELDHNRYNHREIYEWWSSQDEVEYVQNYNSAMNIKSLWIDNRETNANIRLYERPVTVNKIDGLIFVEGEKSDYPGDNEIWLPSVLTNELKLGIGDIISLPFESGRKEFTLSAIVIDPQFNGFAINPRRGWISPGSLPFLFTPGELHTSSIGVHLYDPDTVSEIWNNFNLFLRGRFTGYYTTYSFYISTYTMTLKVVSIFIMFFTIISIFLSSIFIQSAITGNIQANYRQIGILKSLGYTPYDIKLSFIIKYLILALFAIPLSISGSFFLIPASLSSLAKSIGVINNNAPYQEIIILSSVTLLIFILLISYVSSNKAAKLNTIDSIRFGEKAAKNKRYFSRALNRIIHTNPQITALASLFLCDKKGRFFINMFLMMFFSFALFFSFTLTDSISRTGIKRSSWGLSDFEFSISSDGKRMNYEYEELLQVLESNDDVETVFPYGYFTDFSLADIKSSDMRLNTKVFVYDIALSGLKNLQGKHPGKSDEISLAYNTARENGFQVGDEVNIYIYGENVSFTLVGIYQTVTNFGTGCRITIEAVKKYNPMYYPSQIDVKLKPGVNREVFKRQLEAVHGEAVNVFDYEEEWGNIFSTFILIMKILSLVLILIFSLISFFMIVNGTTMEINERKRDIGIMKVLGFTQRQLRSVFLIKLLYTTVVGVLIGTIAGYILTPSITSLLIGKSLGIPDFPIFHSIKVPIIVFFIVISVAALSSWISSANTGKIDPRNLIME